MTTKVCSVCNDFISTPDGISRCEEHVDTERVSAKVKEKRDLRASVLAALGMQRVVLTSGGTFFVKQEG